jgi:hypothetical protein
MAAILSWSVNKSASALPEYGSLIYRPDEALEPLTAEPLYRANRGRSGRMPVSSGPSGDRDGCLKVQERFRVADLFLCAAGYWPTLTLSGLS